MSIDFEKLPLLIPIIFENFIPGYIFVKLFLFASYNDKPNIESTAILSVCISYIIMKLIINPIAGLLPMNNEILLCVSVIISGALSLILAAIYRTNKKWLLGIFHIKRTESPSIWVDLHENGSYPVWCHVYIKEVCFSYLGQISFIDYEKSNMISISKYKAFDENGNEVLDNSNDKKCRLILPMENIKMLELIYHEKSENSK